MCADGGSQQLIPTFFFVPGSPTGAAQARARRGSPNGSEDRRRFLRLSGSNQAVRGVGGLSVRAIVEVAADAHCPLPSLYMSLPFRLCA